MLKLKIRPKGLKYLVPRFYNRSMKKPYKAESTILSLPVVISEAWPAGKVVCLDPESAFNLTGSLEVQCSKATFDEMEADPAKKADVADTVRSIQIALKRKRRVSN